MPPSLGSARRSGSAQPRGRRPARREETAETAEIFERTDARKPPANRDGSNLEPFAERGNFRTHWGRCTYYILSASSGRHLPAGRARPGALDRRRCAPTSTLIATLR